MRNRCNFTRLHARQSGVVLFVALILLLILSMIGVTVARMQTVEERMARNENSRQLAMQAAEAALRSGEDYLAANPPPISTFAKNTNGLYALSLSTGSSIPALNWSTPSNYMAYSGAALNGAALSAAPVAVRAPKVVIEYLPGGALPGQDLSNPPPTYRVTVQGMNADGGPSAALQSIFQ
jgi:type IV pilus assembly protein PilX